MKRIIAICVALAVFLTGCQGVLGQSQQGPVEIEFWHALGGSLGDGLNGIIEAFNASQTDYLVKPVVVGSYSEIDEKLQAAYAASNAPALVAGGSHETFYSKGLVEYFEDYMPTTYDKSDIVGGFMNASMRDGKMAFAPAYGTSQILYFNQDVLKRSGKGRSDLSTWQSIAGLTSLLGTETGKNKIDYVWEPMWGSGNIADMASSNDAQYISEDGKTVLINSDAWVEVLEQVRIWLHEDKTMRIHSGGQGWEYWYKTMDDWVYGKSLGYTGSPGDYVIALEAVTNAINDGVKNDFAAAPQPGWGNNAPKPYFSSLMFYMPKSKNISEVQKKGAAEFITFATNTENTATFAMTTGYAAVRKSVLELDAYKAYLSENPDADAALIQIDKYAVPAFIDPTGGAITTALTEAVDRVQIENVSAKTALDEAAKQAQKALDDINK